MHYRENWYLDAWCHKTGTLRIFALDCIRAAQGVEENARVVPEKEILRHVPEVEILGAPELRRRVQEALPAGLERNK